MSKTTELERAIKKVAASAAKEHCPWNGGFVFRHDGIVTICDEHGSAIAFMGEPEYDDFVAYLKRTRK